MTSDPTSNHEIDNEARLATARQLKATIDTLKPVTDWGMSCNVWAKPDARGGIVRVYINDPKQRAAAILTVEPTGKVTAQWQPGHSMTRNEVAKALGLPL